MTTVSPYLRHRFPHEIIAQCVLLSLMAVTGTLGRHGAGSGDML